MKEFWRNFKSYGKNGGEFMSPKLNGYFVFLPFGEDAGKVFKLGYLEHEQDDSYHPFLTETREEVFTGTREEAMQHALDLMEDDK